VIARKPNHRRQQGYLTILLAEMTVAVVLMAGVLIPLTVGFFKEAKQMRDLYREAVAMEIVDGEMEILAAGGAEGISASSQPYAINAAAATNLPPGKFTLTREGKTLRLEWRANEPLEHLRVNREISLP
jgi:hypothetical protein